jgi:biopolymer transport protein ExbD
MFGTMKKRRTTQSDDSLIADEPILDISSLIDVCFLLLIYFLVTTTIQPREQDLNMTLPVPSTDSPISIPPLYIELKQGGEVVVNPGDAAELYENDVHSRSLPLLKQRLEMISAIHSVDVPRVLIRVHDEVRQQRYIDVINCLADSGIHDIALLR